MDRQRRRILDSKQTTLPLGDLTIDLSDWAGTGDVTTVYSPMTGTDTLTLTGGDLSWGLNTRNNGVFDWNDTVTTSHPGDLRIAGCVDITGENADIKVQGISLVDTLKDLQQRLGWLVPNPELESQWQELRELGDRYRALEVECQQKAEMWHRLNTMPPPEKP